MPAIVGADTLTNMAAQMLDQLLQDMESSNLQSDYIESVPELTLPPYEDLSQSRSALESDPPPVYDPRTILAHNDSAQRSYAPARGHFPGAVNKGTYRLYHWGNMMTCRCRGGIFDASDCETGWCKSSTDSYANITQLQQCSSATSWHTSISINTSASDFSC